MSEEFPRISSHVFLFLLRELGEHGEGQNIAAGALGLGQIALLVSQILEAFLQVQGEGIIDLGADSLLFEVIAQFIPSSI